MTCVKNSCREEPTRYLVGDPVVECKCGKKKKGNDCDNPIRVLSNDVIWNGCELRHIQLKPGDNIEVALQRIDASFGDLYKKYAKLIEVVNRLNDGGNG